MKSGIRLREVLNDPVQVFRALVVLSTAAYLAWFFQLLLGGRLIAKSTWDALSWQGNGALVLIPLHLGWMLMVLSLAVAIGLWRFSKSARLVFVMLSAFSITAVLLGGIQVQTATGSFLLQLANMADGAILVMAYTLPLKERFA